MRINAEGLELIEDFESCRLEAYQDVRGIWTLGFGRTHGITQGMTCTQQEADEWLEDDLAEICHYVATRLPDLNENQFSACVSLAYNIGIGNFRQSDLFKFLQVGAFQNAADEFLKFNHSGGKVIDGLTRRRKAERELFLKS